MRPGFRACYQEFVDRVRLPLSPSLRLSMHVDCTGRVIKIRALANGFDEDTVTCLLQTAASGRFDPPEGGGSVVNFPVTFVRR
jgi:hypothetical protein